VEEKMQPLRDAGVQCEFRFMHCQLEVPFAVAEAHVILSGWWRAGHQPQVVEHHRALHPVGW